jgi:hypothetical protein
MPRPDKKTALRNLTEARKHLEDVGTSPDPIPDKEYKAANEAVTEAEKNVRLGSMRGWKY